MQDFLSYVCGIKNDHNNNRNNSNENDMLDAVESIYNACSETYIAESVVRRRRPRMLHHGSRGNRRLGIYLRGQHNFP